MRRCLPVLLVVGILGALPGAASAWAAGERTIAVVVEFGTGEGLPASFSLCVKEPPGATDAQALADALTQEHLATPSYANTGLLCSLAGYPSTGCGTPTADGYSYWAYFHGAEDHWSYATDGPGERTAEPGTPEGWRFEANGHGNPSDPAPRGPSSETALCPASSPTTTQPLVGTTTTTTTVPGAVAISSTTTSSTVTAERTPARTAGVARGAVHEAAQQPAVATRTGAGSAGVVTGVAVGLLTVLVALGLWLRRRRAS